MNMTVKYFSITKALSDGFNLYFKNLKLLLPITAIVGSGTLLIWWAAVPDFQIPYLNWEIAISKAKTIQTYFYSVNTNLKPEHFLGAILLSIYKAFMINFGFKIYENRDHSLSLYDFLNLDFDMFSYLVSRLRYILTCIAGILFFIIPGLVWIPRYYFSQYFIVDRKLHISESFASSSALAYGVKGKLWLFIFIKSFMFYIFLAGFAPMTALLIYLMLYLPISVLAKISIYKQLLTPKQIA